MDFDDYYYLTYSITIQETQLPQR